MKKQQYHALCEACDRVLLASDSSVERVAIPWLHIIREHPVFLKNYEDIFEASEENRGRYYRSWRRILRNKAGLLRQFGKGFFSNGLPCWGSERLPAEIDVLFVSHLLNASQAGRRDDFYFGNVPDRLLVEGHASVIALINHSGQSGALLVEKWKSSAIPRVIFSETTGIVEYFRLYRRLLRESINLRKLGMKEPSNLLSRVLFRASEEALSPSSVTTLCLASQIEALVSALRPRTIVVTHEGHAWERLAFASARKALCPIACIGYQHAAIFRLQHAIRRNLASQYNPDRILTAGTVGEVQLKNAPALQGLPISVMGSNRSFRGVTSNSESLMDSDQATNLDNPACLVLPEGIASECHVLFEFSLSCAQAFPEIQFVWRLHPLVNFKSLLSKNPKLKSLSRNIVLSQSTFEGDIARCRWALYRGSTAIVQAASAGLRPIYLELPGEMTIDPLYDIEDWRIKVATIFDFQRAIERDGFTSGSSSSSPVKSTKRYCEEFFLPLHLQPIAHILLDWENFAVPQAKSRAGE